MPHHSPQRPTVLLTAPQVAERLGVSRWTVTRWVAAGLIPAVDIGPPGRPRTRIAEHDLEAFIEARRIG